MLKIRPEQLAALRRPQPQPSNADFAAAIRDLGWLDAANREHRHLIGAAESADDAEIARLLAQFFAAKRGEAAQYGIVHDDLVLHYTGFFFRYGAGWTSREDIAPLLAEAAGDPVSTMRTINRVLRLASLGVRAD
jgi:hypothetical protein